MNIDPDYHEKLNELQHFLAGSILKSINFKLNRASGSTFEFQFDVLPMTLQPAGLLSGGVSAMVAESAASIAARLSSTEADTAWVGSELSVHHVRSARSGTVTVRVEPLHTGRRTALWRVETFSEEAKLLSSCTLRLINTKAGS